MLNRRQQFGEAGEALAARLLRKKGYKIVATNYRTQLGEIDIIARDGDTLVFIEVKARPSLVEAAFALGPRQRARLVAAAEAWLADHPGHGSAGMRFDVMLVAADGTIRRIADAFRVEDS